MCVFMCAFSYTAGVSLKNIYTQNVVLTWDAFFCAQRIHGNERGTKFQKIVLLVLPICYVVKFATHPSMLRSNIRQHCGCCRDTKVFRYFLTFWHTTKTQNSFKWTTIWRKKVARYVPFYNIARIKVNGNVYRNMMWQ